MWGYRELHITLRRLQEQQSCLKGNGMPQTGVILAYLLNLSVPALGAFSLQEV